MGVVTHYCNLTRGKLRQKRIVALSQAGLQSKTLSQNQSNKETEFASCYYDQKQSEKERVYSILQLVVYHPGKPRQELTAVLTAHLKVCFALTVPVSLQSFKKACDDASPKGNRSY